MTTQSGQRDHPSTLANFVYMAMIRLILKRLKWLFKQVGRNSEVDFHVDFELKNKILNSLMIKSFDIGLKKIADAFEERAKILFKNV